MTPRSSDADRTHVLPGGRLRTKTAAEKVGGVPRKKLTPKHCGARLKSRAGSGARYCSLRAGFNTDHDGVGNCYRHGGNTKGAKMDAGAEIAYQQIMDPDRRLPSDMVEIEPHNGLLLAVRSSAGEFMFWQEMVTKAATENETVAMMDFVKEMREARMQMARLSKMSLDAGLAERQVQLQERMAELMAAFARELLKAIPLTSAQEKLVPGAVQSALLSLTSGSEYERTPKPTQALRNFKYKDVIEVDTAA